MTATTGLPEKRDVARALLLKGTVFVHLDPRSDEVRVPSWLKRQPQLVLQVGLDMPVPIPDLRVDDAGVFGTLSFNRTSFTCSVPWEAVFAVVGDDGRGMVWPGSMPQEIAAEIERESSRGRVPMSQASAKPEATHPDLTASIDVEQLKPTQRSVRPAKRKPPARPAAQPQTQSAKRAPVPRNPGRLELISGMGGGTSTAKPRTLPPYLRVIK
jgi:stringent starvation protein B